MTDEKKEPMVTLEDVRSLGYCSRGLRAFFAENSLDWNEFRERGLPAVVIEAVDDAMAQRAARIARERAEKGEA